MGLMARQEWCGRSSSGESCAGGDRAERHRGAQMRSPAQRAAATRPKRCVSRSAGTNVGVPSGDQARQAYAARTQPPRAHEERCGEDNALDPAEDGCRRTEAAQASIRGAVHGSISGSGADQQTRRSKECIGRMSTLNAGTIRAATRTWKAWTRPRAAGRISPSERQRRRSSSS